MQNKRPQLIKAAGVVKHTNLYRDLDDAEIKATKGHQIQDVLLPNITTHSSEDSGDVKEGNMNSGHVDTAAPFESVKDAVSNFGGIIDRNWYQALMLKRSKYIQLELNKTQEETSEYKKQLKAAEEAEALVLKELDSSKRAIEELSLSLVKAQMEEAQAKQDLELERHRSKEIKQGITNGMSVAEKAQVEVAGVRHGAIEEKLNSVKKVLEAVQGEHVSLVRGRNMAVRRAEESVSLSKDVEEAVEILTLELKTARESLASARAAHKKAEEYRIGAALARDQDALICKEELKRAEEEMQQLKEKVLVAKDLKSKLDTASNMLLSVQGELTAYMIAKLEQESGSTKEGDLRDGTDVQTPTSPMKELEKVKIHVEEAKDKANRLKAAAVSLQAELENEKTLLASMRHSEEMAATIVSSLQAELNRTKSEIELAELKEKEAREQMVQLPKTLQQAAQQADEAKFAARLAQEALRRAKEEADHAKANATTIKSRLHAMLKEIEALKASESLALAVVKALQESEKAASIDSDDSTGGVNLSLEEYYMLSDRACNAEESVDEKVATALSHVEVAKQSQLKSLKKLEAMNRELAERKEAVRVATDKAEKANERKLAAEQELRMRRSERQQRTKGGEAAQTAVTTQKSLPKDEHGGPKVFNQEQAAAAVIHSGPSLKTYVQENATESTSSESPVRKKSLFPRLVMLLARKKAQP